MKKPNKRSLRLYLKILSVAGFSLVVLCFQNCNNFSTLDAASSGRVLSDSNGLISTESTANLMQRLKYKSCMFDSLVYPAVEDFSNYVALLGRSSCESLPRVIETWAQPPDFVAAAATMASITAQTQKQYDMGMFIAEAISLNTPYNDDQGQPFNFQAMCLPNTANNWGANTCIPTIDSAEYQRYVTYIVGKALDLGIVNFLFGESGLQDPNETLKTFLPTLRTLAVAKGKTAIFGQQPNGNQPAAYLQIFDYVDSPSYVNDDTSQPCLPSITTYCQAVLFNASVIGNANAVLVELDWASTDDDIHRYAEKSLADRQTWITNEAQYIQSIGAGMVMPFRIPLNGGSVSNCYGVNQWVYSSNDAYGCKDEDFLNAILNGTAVASATTTPVAVAPAAVVTPAPAATTTVASPSVTSALTPIIPGVVIGVIDGVVANGDGSYSVGGWACAQSSPNSINVALYLNAPAGQTGAIGIGWFLASNSSEPAVAAACQSTGAAYRFSIPLSVAFIQQYGGDSIYIHGISPDGLANNLLAGSGNSNVPPSSCTAQTLSWSSAGFTCSASFPVTAASASSTQTATATNAFGSASFSCQNGVWTPGASTCSPKYLTPYDNSGHPLAPNTNSADNFCAWRRNAGDPGMSSGTALSSALSNIIGQNQTTCYSIDTNGNCNGLNSISCSNSSYWSGQGGCYSYGFIVCQ